MRELRTNRCKPHKRHGRTAKIERQRAAFERLQQEWTEVGTYANSSLKDRLSQRITFDLDRLRAKGIGRD